MEKFVVTFQVKGDDEENEHLFDTMQQEVEAKDLDSLHTILAEGLADETFQPEMQSAIEGDFNVEYVIIHDSKGNEVYRDKDSLQKDYKEE